MNSKEGMRGARKGQRGENKREKKFHSLGVPPLVDAPTAVASKCGHSQNYMLEYVASRDPVTGG